MSNIQIIGSEYGSVRVRATSIDTVTVNDVPVATMCLGAVSTILKSQLVRSGDVVIRRLVLACKMRLETLEMVSLTQDYAESVLNNALVQQHEHQRSKGAAS